MESIPTDTLTDGRSATLVWCVCDSLPRDTRSLSFMIKGKALKTAMACLRLPTLQVMRSVSLTRV